MESNADRMQRKLRPEATIAKNRSISTIVKERGSFVEDSSLTIEDGHNFSAFEDFSQDSANVDSFVYDDDNKDSSEVPSDDATIAIAGYDHQVDEVEDFADSFEEEGDVVDQLQDMIDSCDEDECSQVGEGQTEEHHDFERTTELVAADFEPAGSPLEHNEEFVAGQYGEEQEQNAFVEPEVLENPALGAECDFSSIAAPPPLEEM